MASAPSTPSNRLSDILGAMTEDTPTAPTPSNGLTRPRSSSDAEDGPELPPRFVLAGQNAKAAVERYAGSKRMRADQTAEAVSRLQVRVSRLQDSQAVRDAKLFIDIKVVENKVDAIVTAQPAFEVSEALQKNIAKYAIATLLSPKLVAYKGNAPVAIIMDIVLKHRFDVPVRIEQSPADLEILKRAVQEALTQFRAKIKRLVGVSLQYERKTRKIGVNKLAHQTIYTLAKLLVEGSNCSVTVELCARVALMRDVYIQYHNHGAGVNLWNKIDTFLTTLRDTAEGDAKRIARAFRNILEHDRKNHGTDNYDIVDNAGTSVQQEVATVIDANTMDAATSVDDGGDVPTLT
ncbi:hypothetical protein C8F01DRAFT_1329803 [Mycena amicta]|nr:hypothetical protein C8F01DRAFT_1329803 [Mycena amicta]